MALFWPDIRYLRSFLIYILKPHFEAILEVGGTRLTRQTCGAPYLSSPLSCQGHEKGQKFVIYLKLSSHYRFFPRRKIQSKWWYLWKQSYWKISDGWSILRKNRLFGFFLAGAKVKMRKIRERRNFNHMTWKIPCIADLYKLPFWSLISFGGTFLAWYKVP